MQDKQATNRQIIRQSMSKLTLEYFNSCGVCPTLSDLVKTTTIMEDYCINGYSSELMMRFDRLDSYINEQYINSEKSLSK